MITIQLKKLVPGFGLILAAVPALASSIDNGSFETGGSGGWNLHIATGVSSLALPVVQTVPAGAVSINSTMGGICWPEDGNYFADLRAGSQYRLAGSPYVTAGQVYDTYLSQTISLDQGDTVSGWAFFFNGDSTAQDSAWIKIRDNSGGEIATPWHDLSGQNCVDASLWTCWSWQAPAAGLYTLQLGVSTQGDGLYVSHGIFDGINVTSVPEPGSSALLLLGFTLLMLKLVRLKAGFPNGAFTPKLEVVRSRATPDVSSIARE